jgi:hypothetical protein
MKILVAALSLFLFVSPVLANPAGDLIAQRNLNRGHYIAIHLPQELGAIDEIIKNQVTNGTDIFVEKDYGYLSGSPKADVQLGLVVADHYTQQGWKVSIESLGDDSIRVVIQEP